MASTPTGGISLTTGDQDHVLQTAIELLRTPSAALVIDGNPGVGKTTVAERIVERYGAHRADRLVLRATGSEAERHVPMAGIASLTSTLAAWTGDDQRDAALATALATGVPAPTLTMALALLDLLTRASGDRDLLLLIDDGQWLDEVSAEVIAFVLRRLPDESRAVVTVRAGEPHLFAGLAVLALDGVTVQDAATILSRPDDPAHPEVVARAHAACSGNPLALTELGRVLTEAQRRGSAPLPEPVPVGRHLTAALGARIAALPADVGRALVVLAACGEIDPDTLDEALAIIDGRLSIEQLETAEHAGLIQLTRGVVRFAHPLMRSVAFGLVSPAEQRAAHRAIAKVLDPTNDRRPWHLAEAAEGPDEEAEQELRSLAARCTASGAHHAAAIAAVRAADVATSTAAAVDLLLQAGESYRMLARTEAASPLFERAISLAVDPRQSWLVRQSRAHLWAWTESTERAVHELLAISRAAESADPAIAATTKMGAAVYASMMGDATRGAVLAREANELATAADDLTKFGVRSMGSFSLLVHGESQEAAPGLADLDLAAAMVTVDAPHVLLEIAQQAGFAQLMQERWAEAGATLSRVADAGHRSALETTASFAHSMLGEVALRTGRWTMARSEVMVGIVGDELNQGTVGMFGHATLARVEAGLGLTTEARTNAELALRQGQKTGMQMLEAWARHALGLVHLVEGDHTNALPQFEWIARLTRRAGYFDPGPLWWQGDYVEVLLDLGRQDDARRYLTSLESEATRHGRRFAQAVVARGRAVLDHDPAQAERSVTLLDALGAPFEAARSRLVWAGEASGTERRDLLLAALNQFESLGAEPWERRTRHALAAIGTNPPVSADPNIAALLTAAEARVALAACRGLTNQQVAQELYLGVKTVETHLSTVYRKLNVRSRTELAVLLANQP